MFLKFNQYMSRSVLCRIALIFFLISLVSACGIQAIAKFPEESLLIVKTDFPTVSPLWAEEIDSGRRMSISLRSVNGYAYIVESIPPGKYRLTSYKSYKNKNFNLENYDIVFEILPNCAHHFGMLNIYGVAEKKKELAGEVSAMAPYLKKQFVGHDFCFYAKDGTQRLPWASVEHYFN